MAKSTAPNKTSKAIESGNATEEGKTPPTPLRCFTGALTSSVFSLLAYKLMIAIAISFANKPIVSDNRITMNIAAAVRTLVIGMAALGAGIFGIAALGLAALGIQLLFKKDAASES